MKKATEFGKALRRIRLDKDEPMRAMAEKLDITIAFLSSVELGKKKPPKNMVQQITNAYGLDSIEKKCLENLTIISYESLNIPISNLGPHQQDLAVGFARRNTDLSLSDLRELFKEDNDED